MKLKQEQGSKPSSTQKSLIWGWQTGPLLHRSGPGCKADWLKLLGRIHAHCCKNFIGFATETKFIGDFFFFFFFTFILSGSHAETKVSFTDEPWMTENKHGHNSGSPSVFVLFSSFLFLVNMTVHCKVWTFPNHFGSVNIIPSQDKAGTTISLWKYLHWIFQKAFLFAFTQGKQIVVWNQVSTVHLYFVYWQHS